MEEQEHLRETLNHEHRVIEPARMGALVRDDQAHLLVPKLRNQVGGQQDDRTPHAHQDRAVHDGRQGDRHRPAQPQH